MSIKDQKATELEIVKQALRHTEMRLEDLEKYASSAEHRLNWFTTLVVALGSALFIYTPTLPAGWASVLTGISLVGIGFVASSRGLSRDFHCRGHFWRDWEGHVEDHDTLYVTLVSQCEENDERIIVNEEELKRSASSFRTAFVLAAWSLAFFGGTQLGAMPEIKAVTGQLVLALRDLLL